MVTHANVNNKTPMKFFTLTYDVTVYCADCLPAEYQDKYYDEFLYEVFPDDTQLYTPVCDKCGH